MAPRQSLRLEGLYFHPFIIRRFLSSVRHPYSSTIGFKSSRVQDTDDRSVGRSVDGERLDDGQESNPNTVTNN